MQFHIPQYIEIEDKLFGPFTLKQAIYVAGGAGAAYLAYRAVPPLFLKAPLIFGIATLTWALAFYPTEKMGRPFIDIMQAAFSYMLASKLYTWKKTQKEPTLGKEEEFIPSKPPATPAVSSGTLASKAFRLDTKKPIEEDEEISHNRGTI